MDFKWEIIPATIADHSIIQNLARFYAYDMSRYCGQEFEGWEFPSDGLYECSDFSKYLKENYNHAFIIKVNNELAGFVFVNKLEVLPETDWNIAEFFIVAKFQRCGIGGQIAKLIFDCFKGEWSVGVIPQNTRALQFWRKVIAEYTDGNFNEIFMTGEQLKTPEHPDPYPMIMIKFKSSDEEKQTSQNRVDIRLFSENDIAFAVRAFSDIGWDKPASLFQAYLKEQQAGTKHIWAACLDKQFAGYVVLELNSNYKPFSEKNIPEIKDLNVLPLYRNRGIGSVLLNMAEENARNYSSVVGIGVGLYPDYGNAQKLYVKRGYIPDGKGITYQYISVTPGVEYKVDDDLVLWFTKKLKD